MQMSRRLYNKVLESRLYRSGRRLCPTPIMGKDKDAECRSRGRHGRRANRNPAICGSPAAELGSSRSGGVSLSYGNSVRCPGTYRELFAIHLCFPLDKILSGTRTVIVKEVPMNFASPQNWIHQMHCASRGMNFDNYGASKCADGTLPYSAFVPRPMPFRSHMETGR